MDVGLNVPPDQRQIWLPNVGVTPAFSRVFAAPGRGLPATGGRAVAGLPAGCLPWISHKDPVPLGQVTAAWSELAYLATPSRNPSSRPIRWTYYHEAAPMGERDRADWRAYWADMARAAYDFPWIELVQIQSNYAMRWRTDTDWRDWIIPGVSLGLDCYPLDGHRYELPESMFALVQHAAAEYGCGSWGVPELGAEPRPGQDRAQWLRGCIRYLREAGAAYVGLWCSQETRNGHRYDYRPNDPATLAAYQEAIRS